MANLRETIKSAQTEMTALALKLDRIEEQEKRQQEMAKTVDAKTVGQLVTSILAADGQFNFTKYYDKRKGGMIRLKVCDVKRFDDVVKAIQAHPKAAELGVSEVRTNTKWRSSVHVRDVVVFYTQPK